MRFPSLLAAAACAALALPAQEAAPADADAAMLARLHRAALAGSPAWDQLRTLVERFPGRLSGTPAYDAAAQWSLELLRTTGCDRVELQPVMVPYWERGAAETAEFLGAGTRTPLAVLALGGSVATPPEGLTAAVVEVPSLEAVRTADVAGKIVFFNGPMDPAEIDPGKAYGAAVGQRSRGAIEAARRGAVAVVVRSMTHALDDHPHTGAMTYAPDVPRIPAAALSTVAAERLSAALKSDPATRLTLAIHARWHEDRPSANVIGEIRGREFPEKVILVAGHLDSWDITPGAHDDGTGCIQSVEVLRLLQAVGYRPRHTIRCVLFANEENGLRGALEYARIVGERKEEHLLALETDSGGFAPRGFNLGNPAGDAHLKAARRKPLIAPYGIHVFQAGRGGADVGPLLRYGYTVAGLMPDSQRYFDYHHTRIDDLSKVNRREFELGAAAMASLVYLVDRHGL
jgi:Zn-dependent M28 family amino/carboxypeptidase